MTQDAYFSCLTHTKQLLLLTFCDTTSENWVSFGHTNTQTHGWTDRRGNQNSYLDSLANNAEQPVIVTQVFDFCVNLNAQLRVVAPLTDPW